MSLKLSRVKEMNERILEMCYLSSNFQFTDLGEFSLISSMAQLWRQTHLGLNFGRATYWLYSLEK